MAADLYNLYPAIGAVNAMRSNYPYAAITGEGMGECNMIINGGKANPPDRAKGAVAQCLFIR
ncbi:MAG: endonuclease [Candidatus Methanofishera endochildressiae]|uniref:Endonuclease n=1 Tax=Candidatus Methanofishera endochildressiae TaxID=2738884 RepID=A0A7Z0MMD5_9GAMM|nr:endonuclease [Candidatus Methanofishera endochildressiae]